LYLGLVGLGAAMAAVIVGAVVLAGQGRDSDVGQSPREAAAAAEETAGENRVLITVKGAPQGAKVYYRDILVPMNPFPVNKGDTIAPLKVEAEGYETFTIALIPSEDRVVEVKLERSQRAEEAAPAKAAAPDTKAGTAVSAKAKDQSEKKSETKQPSKKSSKAEASPPSYHASGSVAEVHDSDKKKKKKKSLKKKGKSGEFAGSFE
jgi:hypothetical protein